MNEKDKKGFLMSLDMIKNRKIKEIDFETENYMLEIMLRGRSYPPHWLSTTFDATNDISDCIKFVKHEFPEFLIILDEVEKDLWEAELYLNDILFVSSNNINPARALFECAARAFLSSEEAEESDYMNETAR